MLLAAFACLFVAGAAAGCSRQAAVAHPAATVGGASVTRTDVASYTAYAMRYYVAAGTEPPRALRPCLRFGSGAACAAFRRQALIRLIQEQAVLNYGAKHRIALDRRDTALIGAAVDSLASGPEAREPRSLLRSIVRRAFLVRKIEEAVTRGVTHGLAYHVRTVAIPLAGGSETKAYRRALEIATVGGNIPVNARSRVEWIAAFRVPAPIRSSIRDAAPGQYLGPFRGASAVKVVELLGKADRRYGKPARLELETSAFQRWLDAQLALQGVRCFDGKGGSARCPMNDS